MKMPPGSLMIRRYRAGLGIFVGSRILLLTTIGRRSGRAHTVAVQYDRIDGKYVIGAAGGLKSDWLRNIQADSGVRVEIGRTQLSGKAEVILEPGEITRLLEYRIKKHPVMLRIILKMDGLGFNPTHAQLEAYARRLAFVMITPTPRGSEHAA